MCLWTPQVSGPAVMLVIAHTGAPRNFLKWKPLTSVIIWGILTVKGNWKVLLIFTPTVKCGSFLGDTRVVEPKTIMNRFSIFDVLVVLFVLLHVVHSHHYFITISYRLEVCIPLRLYITHCQTRWLSLCLPGYMSEPNARLEWLGGGTDKKSDWLPD